MSDLRFSKLPNTASERVLDLFAALFLGVLLLLSFDGFGSNFLVETDRAYGQWPLFVLPIIGTLVMALLFWVQSSDWPISLPFKIQGGFHERAQRQVRLLLRLLNFWMQLVLALLQYLISIEAAASNLLLLTVTALLVDLVLIMFALMRLSRLAA
jgi:hypothetical protein